MSGRTNAADPRNPEDGGGSRGAQNPSEAILRSVSRMDGRSMAEPIAARETAAVRRVEDDARMPAAADDRALPARIAGLREASAAVLHEIAHNPAASQPRPRGAHIAGEPLAPLDIRADHIVKQAQKFPVDEARKIAAAGLNDVSGLAPRGDVPGDAPARKAGGLARENPSVEPPCPRRASERARRSQSSMAAGGFSRALGARTIDLPR